MSAHKCEGRIYQGPGFGFKPCGKNAAYEHEGKWFCKTHHPPTIKAKSAARTADLQAKWAAQDKASKAKSAAKAEQKRRADCYPDLLAALKECAAVCAGETMNKNGLIRALEMSRAAIAKATEGKS
jgi:hypothetical protein